MYLVRLAIGRTAACKGDRQPADPRGVRARVADRRSIDLEQSPPGRLGASPFRQGCDKMASIVVGIDVARDAAGIDALLAGHRWLACTDINENINGTARRVCRSVKRWRNAPMAQRWSSAARLEAARGLRRLKIQKQLPKLRTAMLAHQRQHALNPTLDRQAAAAQPARPAMPAEHASTPRGTSPRIVPGLFSDGDAPQRLYRQPSWRRERDSNP